MRKNLTLEEGRLSLKSWVLLVFLAIVWGSSFILMKRGLFDADGNQMLLPEQLAALRMSLAGLALLPMAIKHFKKSVSRKNILFFIIVGVCGNGLPAFLFAIAQTQITSSLSGLLNSLVPLFTMIIGLTIFKIKPKWFNATGVIIGLGGALGLILVSKNMSGDSNIMYALLVVVATLCYAISVNTIKSKMQDIKSIAITSIGFSLIMVPCAFYLGTTDFVERVQHLPGALESVGYVAILALVGTGLAVVLFNDLVKETTAIFASSVTYLIPIVAIMWGVLDGEVFTMSQALFTLVILSGVYLVNKKEWK